MMNKYTVAFLLCISSFFYLPHLAYAAPAKNEVAQLQTMKVNINTAQLEELILLPGIGTKKASAIIEYRTKHGKFESLEEVANVKGIGEKMLQKLQDKVTLK
ncbi:ComEA family DNA-binding protein [Paraglaciecola sp. 2405UD69-4]|uniref:ComEA family DNA-binding protein n=1 Tax=Paraglaciecola sp. 2405UD69-4 TaxID=3391836 RepID=UPI0039C94860